ncbi:hypothetical protein PMG11_05715 [Penicillium brasilianum]|uniref:Uncharacterized protein n=1 Tax=Penicillium brasilianum TaxID=104259 RepID=A0A0F7TNM7_PENBI|nr:hypothetical protein PMG11_05715 [Penicillium brasilianum]
MLHISATGLDGGFYVQGVKSNGKQRTENWFEHDNVMANGGHIEFELGQYAKATESGELSPSPGHVQLE